MNVVLNTLATLASIVEAQVEIPPNLRDTALNGRNNTEDCLSLVPEDATLSFLGLAAKYGYPGEAYQVITEDGYKLTVFRIPGNLDALPVLLFHGVLDSADTWIDRGNTSLAITLAQQGYELWFGNVRGNKYSRGHVSAEVESDPAKYWNFTFDEHGKYDLAATVDYVLNFTGAPKLNGIGHSQGTTIHFVLCSSRPEYNDKINSVIALAPIAYLQNTPPPVSTVIDLSPILYTLARDLNIQDVLQEDTFPIQFLRLFCPLPNIGYKVCALGIFFPVAGYDPAQFGPCFLRVFVGHFPTSTSVKNLYHLAQLGSRGQFAQFDYGPVGNEVAYNSITPPLYDLTQVTTKVALLVGGNDHLSTIDDVALLRRQLPNVAAYKVISRPLCNHIDFIAGKTMSDYLFPVILDGLRTYGNN